MMTYYDKVLAGIGALLGVGAIMTMFTSPFTIIIFSVLAMALVGHAMFINPPVELPQEKPPTAKSAD